MLISFPELSPAFAGTKLSLKQIKKKMRYRIEVEIPENKVSFAEEFFKSISFVRKVRAIASNEITNAAILQSIESYESGQVNPPHLACRS